MFWNSGPVLKQCQVAYLSNGIHLHLGTPEYRNDLRVCASALVEVMKGMMDRMYMVVHHYKTPGAYQPLREQYAEIGRRLSHVYCWMLNIGDQIHLTCLYGGNMLAGLPCSLPTSLRPYVQTATHGELAQDGVKVFSYSIPLYTGCGSMISMPETISSYNRLIHDQDQEYSASPLWKKYLGKVGIIEFNPCGGANCNTAS